VRWAARVAMVAPWIALWYSDHLGTIWAVLIGAVVMLMCLVQDASRSPRTPQYEIMIRASLTFWLPLIFFWWLLEGSWDAFWLISYGCYFGVGWFLWVLSIVALVLESRSDPAYDQWRNAGGHPVWDGTLMFPFWNPDSEFVRCGGIPGKGGTGTQ